MTSTPGGGPPQEPHGLPHGQPGYPFAGYPPEHPRATTAMVLGVLGLAACGICAPFAWVIGGRTVREIDASGGRLAGRDKARAGFVMGIIGSVLLAVAVAGFTLYLVFLVVLLATGLAAA